MTVYAFVPDLMDRSRITAALDDVTFTDDPAACSGAQVVIIDLARCGAIVRAVRAVAPCARIVGFLPHLDGALAAEAEAGGVDVSLPRARFFRDVAAATAPPGAGT